MNPVWSVIDDSTIEELRAILATHRDEIQVFGGPAADAQRNDLPIHVDRGLAEIPIEGIITRMYMHRRQVMATEAAQAAVRAAAADADVDVILLRVNSPGGSVDGLAQLADAVRAARQVKPVVAQVAGTAASAAYYVASQATQIVAERGNLVGSLGARMLLFDMHRMAEQIGIEAVALDTAPEDRPFKSAGAPGTQITATQRAEFQRIVDAFGDDFRRAIREGRSMTDEQVGRVFDGRVWLADEALELRLIDRVQSIEATRTELGEQLRLSRRDRTARAKARAMGPRH